MSKEIAKPQLCVLIRSGLELWIDADSIESFELAVSDTSNRLVNIQGQRVNPYEIIGVFTPDAMEERQRRKNGQWKCMKGRWHEKGAGCGCSLHNESVTAYVEGVGEVTYKK